MKILYFSWFREQTGLAQEDITLPEAVTTINELIEWMKGRGEGYAHAFESRFFIRAALDQEHVDLDAEILEAQEIAFFPPFSGG